MSSAAKSGENAATRQGRKKKRILIALGAITLITWSRQLLGSEGEAKAPAARQASSAAREKPGAAAPAKTARAGKSITTFEQAMDRMEQWPEALQRRVFEGTIAELSTPKWHGSFDAEPAPQAEPEPQRPAASAPLLVPKPAPEKGWTGPGVVADSLPLLLRSTVLFGDTRVAVINGTRYAEGDEVVIPDGPSAGRYVLAEIRSREVLLRQGARSWTLSIRDQSAPFKKPDSAD